MNVRLKERIEKYFEYRSQNHGNNAFGVYDQEDKEMLQQLPEEV